jgi:hypothetical protein
MKMADDMRNAIGDLIDYSANGEFNQANGIFNELMAGRIGDAIEQEKVAMADTVYNSNDEDQLEMDLEGDEDYSDEELDAAADEVVDVEDENLEAEDESEAEEEQ